MKFIDRGFFYKVFECANSRVLKKKRNFLDILLHTKPKHILQVLKQNKEAKKQTLTMKSMLPSVPNELFGNPYFVNKYNYTQDRVELLYRYFDKHTLEENKLMFEKYLNLITELMKYGVHDRVYKFKNSYGVTNEGNVIFIDFNELEMSKEKVIDLISSGHFFNEAQYTKFPAGKFKDFMHASFKEKITVRAVEDVWMEKVV